MESSRIGNSLAVAVLLVSLLLSGCELRKDNNDVVLPDAVRTVMYDTASVNFIDFSNYGELRSLPIGIFDADSTSMTLLETVRAMDCFDNITGARRSDGILDLAGEYFQYYTAQSDDDCLRRFGFHALCYGSNCGDRPVKGAACAELSSYFYHLRGHSAHCLGGSSNSPRVCVMSLPCPNFYVDKFDCPD